MKNKVLIVDDNESVLIIIKTLLEDAYDVCTASGYQDFINIFRKENPDVVVVDLKLGDGRGTDARNWLQQNGFEVPVILITGDLGDLPGKEWHGFVNYFQKPLKYERLLEAIELAILRSR